jgi:RimJ/RimL family protein N-acetyltransferase
MAHAKKYSDILSEEGTFHFLTESGPVTEIQARKKISLNSKSYESGKSVYWSLLGVEGQFFGFIAVHNLQGERVFISYGIHPSQRRKGYGSEGLKTVLNWDFLKGKEIEMAVHKENEPSFRMLSKMDLDYLGVRKTVNGDRHVFTTKG